MSQHTTTSLFRRLAWQSTIPVEVRLAGDVAGSDVYYMQAPRYTYLPLLIPEIRENLVEVALDDQAFAEADEKEWWFEEDPGDEAAGGEGNFAPQGPCKWHWPLDLIHLHSIISRPLPSSSSSSSSSSTITPPLRLRLHLSNPPIDKLNLPNGADQCRTQWVNQVKEADFVRWRNTSRTTGLRKGDFDAGWDGIVNDDFDSFTRFSSRILPPPSSAHPPSSLGPSTSSSGAGPSRPASTDPALNSAKVDSAYTVRALPIKLYLPDNAPVVHEMIPPIGHDGKPQTLLSALHAHLPLLFPPRSAVPYPLAIPILHGVEVPPDAELAWLSTCCCGADGWLRIGIRLRAG